MQGPGTQLHEEGTMLYVVWSWKTESCDEAHNVAHLL